MQRREVFYWLFNDLKSLTLSDFEMLFWAKVLCFYRRFD